MEKRQTIEDEEEEGENEEAEEDEEEKRAHESSTSISDLFSRLHFGLQHLLDNLPRPASLRPTELDVFILIRKFTRLR